MLKIQPLDAKGLFLCRNDVHKQGMDDCEARVMTERKRKYEIEHIIRAFCLFVAARREALAVGFNDNAGAIIAVTRENMPQAEKKHSLSLECH